MTHVWQFDAIGTVWRIDTDDALTDAERAAVAQCIDDFDAVWSRFRADSLVAALAGGAGAVPSPPDAADMLAAYEDLGRATCGAVNPLVGDALSRRGYDATLSLRDRGAVASPDPVGRVQIVDGRLIVSPPALLDVGALGKGRLVDLVLEELPRHREVIVDASGDLAVRGAPQRIGLEHPYDPKRAIGVWEVTDAALCASATNRRAWGDGLHHVLDARTGEPVRTVAAVWAVAPTAMRADAIATGLFFDGGPELAHEWGVSWVRMFTDGRLEWSPDCAAELFLRGSSVVT